MLQLTFKDYQFKGMVEHYTIEETGEKARTNPDNGNVEVFDGVHWTDKYRPIEINNLDKDGELLTVDVMGYEEI